MPFRFWNSVDELSFSLYLVWEKRSAACDEIIKRQDLASRLTDLDFVEAFVVPCSRKQCQKVCVIQNVHSSPSKADARFQTITGKVDRGQI